MDQVPGQNLNILDLGCGPGLYCEKLAKKDHCVTGVDISSTSIDYAVDSARKKSMDITYINSDYLDLELASGEYDLVIMIYTDFGVLLPDERAILLEKVFSALKPGGLFIFDVINDSELESKVLSATWEAVPNGFWSPKPYLLLSNAFHYREEKVILYQHNVLHENGQMETYRFWTHHFSERDVDVVLKGYPFTTMKRETNIIPAADPWSGGHVTFYVMKK
jgi:2-polyprenyl-3-methyl-5-hydroxy-6-metoxy-1,4-benzoquinol methylase